VLSSWHLRNLGRDQEELKIEAGPDLITVSGRGLARIAAALDQSSLEVISETASNRDIVDDSKIFVSAILFESIRE
jgi:hypothetical protein